MADRAKLADLLKRMDELIASVPEHNYYGKKRT